MAVLVSFLTLEKHAGGGGSFLAKAISFDMQELNRREGFLKVPECTCTFQESTNPAGKEEGNPNICHFWNVI